MNLRENKMDEYDTPKKIGNIFDRKKTPQQKQFLSAPQQPQKIQSAQQQQQIQQTSTRSEEWIRKEPKNSPPEIELDYQENIDYPKEYSHYIQQNKEDILVHWRGPEFEHYPRDKKWYTGAAIILALVILYAVMTDSIIMAIVFALIGISGYIILSQPQKEIDFGVTYDGILVGDELYDFDDIKSFWIFYEPPHTRVISLHMRGYFRPYLHIPLHQVDPVFVHKALVEFVPEERQEQNIIDILERLLRM